MSRGAKWFLALTFVLVLFSLALNAYLIWQAALLQTRAMALQQEARSTVSRFREELSALGEATLSYTVHIDQEIPIDAVVPFREELEIPIQTTVPISQQVQTTVNLEIRSLNLSLPVDVNVPIDLEVPIDMSVPVQIDRQVPVRTIVPIELDVPVAIRLAETDLARYIELLDQGLADLERALGGAQE